MLLQIITPTNISINGYPCSIQLNLTLSNVVPNDTTSGISPFSEEVIAGDRAKVEQATSGSVSSHIIPCWLKHDRDAATYLHCHKVAPVQL